MNTFMHGPGFFSFHFFSFSISFPILIIFTILRLCLACKMCRKITTDCAHFKDIELKTGRKIPYFRFPHVLFSIQLDWRALNYKTKKIYFLLIQKRSQKQAQKDMIEME